MLNGVVVMILLRFVNTLEAMVSSTWCKWFVMKEIGYSPCTTLIASLFI
jgi:hypothetical protein